MSNDPVYQQAIQTTRRTFIGQGARGVGALALGTMLATDEASAASDVAPLIPHFAPRAKRVVCLLQSGGVSHVDLFDYKPTLAKFHGQEIPPSVKGDQRLTGMTSGQSAFPVTQPVAQGKLCGEHRTWISDLLPHTQKIADKIAVIKSMRTEAINHDPAVTFVNTGNQQPGYPSMGAWVSYGLGSENRDLPTFITMTSQGSGKNPGQPIFSRLWGSGFLPSTYQGVGLRPGANAVLYLQDPPGVTRGQRRQLLDDLNHMNQLAAQRMADAETLSRIQAYEMAFRMQTSVPELTDLSGESAATFDSYGPDAVRPGSYAANCLLARRLLERGVRFVQLFHRGWDQHIALARQLPRQCQDVDQPTAALVNDLEQRGLLDETLVLFATEFGRTVYTQGKFDSPGAGRDHHGRCFTIWMAGGGVRGGVEYGRTDDFCYNIAENPVHLRDMHATVLHCLGIDFGRFTHRFRGLDVGLTGVEPARVVKEVLS